jgi:hypothetical protein
MAAPKSTGRPKGSASRVTMDVKELARDYTEEAVLALAQVMRGADSDAAKVAAAKELLDRGHGKAKQVVDATVAATVEKLTRSIVDPRA